MAEKKFNESSRKHLKLNVNVPFLFLFRHVIKSERSVRLQTMEPCSVRFSKISPELNATCQNNETYTCF